MDVVKVEGMEITPEEFNATEWLTKIDRRRQALVTRTVDKDGGDGDAAAGETGRRSQGGNGDATQERAARKKEGRRLARQSIASPQPGLPRDDFKIIMRPRDGFNLSKVPMSRLF
ncbi:hypothetical protein HPB48_019026 [Haemaphysalis longicornis]|uniref:Uncharacterized protein n=1 Tax=Haemaphysalis longicornis TaxID=44386 RepID=A0A9J6F6X2_HAELO|nr:hypothetical protein HPB48_019026 [Haemaphysalis longicornis]